MKDYPDTSFVLSLYVQDVHSPKATASLAGRNRPLAVTALLAFEVEQALELAMFRQKLPPAQGHKALSDWQAAGTGASQKARSAARRNLPALGRRVPA